MLTEIEVTIEDLVYGSRRNGLYCPIARAVNRALRADYVTVVGTRSLAFKLDYGNLTPDALHRVDLPLEVVQFIYRYDSDRAFTSAPRPIKFTIDIPDRMLKEAHEKEKTKGNIRGTVSTVGVGAPEGESDGSG